MWQTAPAHPASLWVRTGGSMISTSAWDWPSAPASSSEAALSSRRRDFCGWQGRGRCGQVLTSSECLTCITAELTRGRGTACPTQAAAWSHSLLCLYNTGIQQSSQASVDRQAHTWLHPFSYISGLLSFAHLCRVCFSVCVCACICVWVISPLLTPSNH